MQKDKPVFRLSGGLYYVEVERSGNYYQDVRFSRIFAVYTPFQLARLFDVSRWWRGRDADKAKITDDMMCRYASFWRYEGINGNSPWHGDVNCTLAKYPRFEARKVDQFLAAFKPTNKNGLRISKELVAQLIAAGYCRVSNKYLHLSRIDRPDWREYLAEQHAPRDPDGQGMRWSLSSGMGNFYRRGESKDVIVLPENQRGIFNLFPSSDGGPDHYTPLLVPHDNKVLTYRKEGASL